jgi:hypothetical protein
MARPKKVNWPIKFDELLRIGFPKKRIEDRHKFHRFIVGEKLFGQLGRKPTDSEILQGLEENKAREFNSEHARYMLQYFRAAMPIFSAQLRRERARTAALARWRKSSE